MEDYRTGRKKVPSNKEIAETLKLSDGTVRNYLSTILNKLDLRDRTQLAIWAVQTNAAGKTCGDGRVGGLHDWT